MKWKRLGSSLLALVLVCCLIFNMMTVPVKAVEVVAAQWIGVAATTVIASALIGLGIQRDTSQPSVFDDLVGRISTKLEGFGIVADGLMSVLGYKKADGQTMYALQQATVETILDSVYDMGVVTSVPKNGLHVTAGAKFGGGLGEVTAPVDGTIYEILDGGVLWFFYSTSPFEKLDCSGYGLDGTVATIEVDGVLYYFAVASGFDDPAVAGIKFEGGWKAEYIPGLIRGEFEMPLETGLQEGLVAGSVIGSNVIPFEQQYSDWADEKIEYSEDDNQPPLPYVPIGIGSTYEDTASKNQEDVWDGLSEYTTAVLGNWQQLLQGMSSVKGYLSSIGSVIRSLPELIVTPITGAIHTLGEAFPGILEAVVSIPGAMEGLFQYFVATPVTAIADAVTAIRSGEITIPQALADTLTAVFVAPILDVLSTVFVPSEDYLTVKVEALRAEFGFADSIVSTAEFIRDIFNSGGSEPPVIWIDLGATRGSYNIGGKIKFIDMSWYAEYKPTVDKLLAALMWICFAWKMFKRLPGIISGMPGDFVMDGLHSVGLDNLLPSRNAVYEVQRQSLRSYIRRGK